MAQIKLHAPIPTSDARRLRFFAGRTLTEHDFDLMQGYVDARCDQALAAGQRGIVEGLEASIEEGEQDNPLYRVTPGLAVGGDYRVIRVFYPIITDWLSLKAEYLRETTPPGAEATEPHGLYFLTVKRRVTQLDYQPDADPCTRTEPDPLRDSRLETYGTLGLHYIKAMPWWLTDDLADVDANDKQRLELQRRAATNHVLAYHLHHDVWQGDEDFAPIALIRIDHGRPLWLDMFGGRYLATPNSSAEALFAHWQSVASQPLGKLEKKSRLAEILGVGYLPPAGELPAGLITDIAGQQDGSDAKQWTLPKLNFNPEDLQIELLPVPANSVDGVIAYEKYRGAVDLMHLQQDRLRVMVAVAEEDWRPTLMDLPQIDKPLIEDLFLRQVEAMSTYNEWANQFDEIYGGLADKVKLENGEPDAATIELFERIYKTAAPVSFMSGLEKKVLKALDISPGHPAPATVAATLSQIVEERNLKPNEVVRPYSEFFEWENEKLIYRKGSLPTPDLPEVTPRESKEDEHGLYRRQADLQAEIEELQELLTVGTDVISEVNDFIMLQRQQLDSITVSFSTLAGGVAGDGSGLSLMRWSSSVKYGDAEAE